MEGERQSKGYKNLHVHDAAPTIKRYFRDIGTLAAGENLTLDALMQNEAALSYAFAELLRSHVGLELRMQSLKAKLATTQCLLAESHKREQDGKRRRGGRKRVENSTAIFVH